MTEKEVFKVLKVSFFMRSILRIIRNEYDNEYDLTPKKKYSKPVIYDAGGDLSKRWYVYFSFRNPKTDKLERQAAIYDSINRFTTKRERLAAAKALRNAVETVLENGYNPYTEEEELEYIRSIDKAINYVLDIKKNQVSPRTLKDYRSHLETFSKWLNNNGHKSKPIQMLDKKAVSSFLNHILKKTSPRSRNNYRISLRAFFQILEDNEHIKNNPVSKIPVLKTSAERNRTYDEATEKDIWNYMDINDPLLSLFVKFVAYGFLRPVEVCRLKIKDVNLKSRKLTFRAKNKLVKEKIIPEILFNAIPDLSDKDPDGWLFSPTGIGEKSDSEETNRRDYFSKRFLKIKKHFGLGANYGMYSFRHTYATKVYRNLRKSRSPFEAKSDLMLITGHASMAALEKYLRDIDAELPEDYSHLILSSSKPGN